MNERSRFYKGLHLLKSESNPLARFYEYMVTVKLLEENGYKQVAHALRCGYVRRYVENVEGLPCLVCSYNGSMARDLQCIALNMTVPGIMMLFIM